jgi:hypothetical protein
VSVPDSPVGDQRPPAAVLKVLNPVLRGLIDSPLGRALPGSLVVLEFSGRRSGRRYRIVVGWHDLDGDRAVFTPARWRLNFRGGAPVSVRHKGRTLQGTGTLEEDPEAVAEAFRRVIDAGESPRMLGLRVPAGHRIGAADVRATGRALVRLEVAGRP